MELSYLQSSTGTRWSIDLLIGAHTIHIHWQTAVKQNRHHAIHHRLEWTARPESEYIRENPSLIFDMEVPLHTEIHRNVPPIPLLGVHALQRVVRLWRPDVDKLKSLGNLQSAIERASQHPKAHYVERELAQLAIHAIDLQKPYLAKSLGERKFIIL